MTKNKKQGVFGTFRVLFPIVYKTSPVTYIMLETVSFLHALGFVGLTVAFQILFDTAGRLLNAGAEVKDVVFALVLLTLVTVFWQVMNAVENFIPIAYGEKSKGILSQLIQDKVARLNALDFENTAKLDDINKAEQGKNNAIEYVVQFSWIFSFYIPYFVLMTVYFVSLKPLLAILIVLIFVPTVITYYARTRIFSKLEDESAPLRREKEYYESCIVDREYFKETRLLGAYGYFSKLYKDKIQLLNKLGFRSNLKSKLYEASMKFVTILGYIGILLLLFFSVLDQSISIGAFVSIFTTMTYLFLLMDELVCKFIGDMTKNLGTIRNFLNFLNMEERRGIEKKIDLNGGIRVENISFTYPTKDTPALKNISFTIEPGETIAIVGENGSGKTTLIKLLTGIYLPQEGDIYYGECNTKTVAQKSLYKEMSAVFQQFQQYKMTLKENITISDTDNAQDIELIDKVSQLSGFSKDDEIFPEGYDTMLSREFDGVDLSGGNWQRIATARSLYRNHELIVLDEPTAAIDPIEETRIYQQFSRISRDKTAVIVTHRLGSVKLADRILVLKDGELVECGTHEELIKCNGEYARLYKSQEQWYVTA